MRPHDSEYFVLRQTIATRGTARVLLAPCILLGWGGLSAVQFFLIPSALPSLWSLALLAAGFEAIHALHVGVERIGRYLQVYYEEIPDYASEIAPRWESTAMRPRVRRGGGTDPLFTLLLAGASLVNLATLLSRVQMTAVTAAVAALHLALVVRMLWARSVAAGQRERDLAHYRELRNTTGRSERSPQVV